MSTPAPAGWYPDPADGAMTRYWDGSSWTIQVRPRTPQEAPAEQMYRTPYTSPGAPAPLPAYDRGAGMLAVEPVGLGRLGPDGQVLSGWWRRVGGYLIDALIVAVVAAIAGALAVMAVGSSGDEVFYANKVSDLNAALDAGETVTSQDLLSIIGPGFWPVFAFTIAAALVVSFLNGVVLIAFSGQTIGDRLVGVRKVMRGRVVPSFWVALVRWVVPTMLYPLLYLLTILRLGWIVGLLDYLWPLWDGKSQTLHDKMVGTYVERAGLAGPPVRRR